MTDEVNHHLHYSWSVCRFECTKNKWFSFALLENIYWKNDTVDVYTTEEDCLYMYTVNYTARLLCSHFNLYENSFECEIFCNSAQSAPAKWLFLPQEGTGKLQTCPCTKKKITSLKRNILIFVLFKFHKLMFDMKLSTQFS